MPPSFWGYRFRRKSRSTKAELSPMARSFYAESKRVRNDRIKSELGVTLRYPDYRARPWLSCCPPRPQIEAPGLHENL
jgi:hypothetical protein